LYTLHVIDTIVFEYRESGFCESEDGGDEEENEVEVLRYFFAWEKTICYYQKLQPY
jgi:hypothetical protein